MSARVEVNIRVRPLLDWELKKQMQRSKLKLDLDQNELRVGDNDKETEKVFQFDRISDETSTQEQFYQQTNINEHINRVIEGYHASIFAYGQTGAGKTYTMDGYQYQVNSDSPDRLPKHRISDVDSKDLGVIPRAISNLYETIAKAAESTNRTFSVYCSMLEIYNERIFDLLNPEQVSKLNVQAPGLRLRWNKRDQFVVENLFVYECQTSKEALSLFQIGLQNKIIATHKLNNTSSRSHCLFEFKVESYNNNKPTDTLSSKLVFIDLAGSERINSTGNEGRLAKETIDINKSLFTLRQVITTISENSGRRDVHIPYRDSKLTSLLKQSFGGNSYCLMIACLSPSDEYADENISTLTYAAKARRIENKPVKNDDPQIKHISELKMKNNDLIQELIKANDHIAFLSRLTNEEVKSFGQSHTEGFMPKNGGVRRSQDDMYKMQGLKDSLNASREFRSTGGRSKFQFNTIQQIGYDPSVPKDDQRSLSPEQQTSQSPQKGASEDFLEHLSESYKNMNDNEKNIPEYLSKELVHSISQIRHLLGSLKQEREKNELLTRKNDELEGLNIKLMTENQELRDRIEILERINQPHAIDTQNTQNSEMIPSSTKTTQAVDEIMRLTRERLNCEKRIRDLEDQNFRLTAGSGFYPSSDKNQKRSDLFTPQSRSEAGQTPQHISGRASARSTSAKKVMPIVVGLPPLDENDNHFRTTTNFARNTMYRNLQKTPEPRNLHSSEEPTRSGPLDEQQQRMLNLPSRIESRKPDFYGLSPIPEQKSINNTLQSGQTDNPEKLQKSRVKKSLNLSHGSKNGTHTKRPKSLNRSDILTLNEIYMPAGNSSKTKLSSNFTSREEKLMKMIHERRHAPKIKTANTSFL